MSKPQKDLILVSSDPITQNKLFLSFTEPGSKSKLINYYHITTIIVLNQKPPQQFHASLQYYVHIYDETNPDYNYIHLFNSTTEEIHQSLSKGGVIVYCASPILNASASICIAYLMRFRDFNYEKAFYTLKYLNSIINPSINFRRQLQIYFQDLSKQRLNIGMQSQSPSSLISQPFIDGMKQCNNENYFMNQKDEFSFQNYDEKQNNTPSLSTQISNQQPLNDHFPTFNNFESECTLAHSPSKAYLDAKKIFHFTSRVAKVITHNLSKSKKTILEKNPNVFFMKNQKTIPKVISYETARLITEPASVETVEELETIDSKRKIMIKPSIGNKNLMDQSIDTILQKHQMTILNLNSFLKKNEQFQKKQQENSIDTKIRQPKFIILDNQCSSISAKKQSQPAKKSQSFSNDQTIKPNKPLWRDPTNILKNSRQIKEDGERRLSVNDKSLPQQRWRTQRLSVHQAKDKYKNSFNESPKARYSLYFKLIKSANRNSAKK